MERRNYFASRPDAIGGPQRTPPAVCLAGCGGGCKPRPKSVNATNDWPLCCGRVAIRHVTHNSLTLPAFQGSFRGFRGTALAGNDRDCYNISVQVSISRMLEYGKRAAQAGLDMSPTRHVGCFHCSCRITMADSSIPPRTVRAMPITQQFLVLACEDPTARRFGTSQHPAQSIKTSGSCFPHTISMLVIRRPFRRLPG